MQASAEISWENKVYTSDLFAPISIALSLKPGPRSVRAWHAPELSVEPVVTPDWTGSVAAGAPVNFMNLSLNLHGNGTHTETLGHIAEDWQSNTVLSLLPSTPFVATLHEVPTNVLDNGDEVADLTAVLAFRPVAKGLILKVLRKSSEEVNFSDTNPPYFKAKDLKALADLGIDHLITDLPSVDREIDGGELAAHHAWWNFPEASRKQATITELADLDQHLPTKHYLVYLNALPLAADASPCHPLLYALKPKH